MTKEKLHNKKRIITTLLLLTFVILTQSCSNDFVKKGNTCISLGDYDMAIDFFEKALEKKPQNPQARLGLGKSLLQKAINTNSVTCWKKAHMNLKAAETLTGDVQIKKLLSQSLTHYSKIILKQNDTLTALSTLLEAIEYDHKNVEPLNLAGILYFKLGYGDKSKKIFSTSASIDTSQYAAYFNLGMIYWQNNNITKANAYWLKALTKAPKNDDILYWYALSEKKIRESGKK